MAPDPHDGMLFGDPSVELSSNRTAMSLERTRLSIERTLMSVIRTSLSLISFGFTIDQFFNRIAQQRNPGSSARAFGISLVILGILLLILGLAGHVQQIAELRRRRDELHGLGLLRHAPEYRPTAIAIVASLLLLLGLVAVTGMMLRAGPIQ